MNHDRIMALAGAALLPGYRTYITKHKINTNMSDNQQMNVQQAIPGIIYEIAAMAHWANRSYCHMLGDHSQPKWEDAPDWQKNSAIAGVEMHYKNPHAGPEQSHESWSRQKLEEGWKYGEVKDPEKKEHPCLVAYDKLPFEQQMKDSIFGGIVKAMLKKAIDAGRLPRPAMTRGQEVMNVQFNPGGLKSVNIIKTAFADLHDLLQLQAQETEMAIIAREQKLERALRQENMTAEEREADNKAQSSANAAIYPYKADDMRRLMAMSLTSIENAQMQAVKAVTR